MLFASWSNVRRDIRAACEREKIDMCSPNDLRRTTVSWFRAKGVPAEIIGQGWATDTDGWLSWSTDE
jgi:hypothetical protein